jgi:hypothetical protein
MNDISDENDDEAESWTDIDRRLAAVALVAQLPSHDLDDALKVLDYARLILTKCVMDDIARV